MDQPSDSSHPRLERRAILVTVCGNLFMAALGFGFAFATRSQAVLLDGVYSLIGCGLALLGLRVSTLVHRPDDERYPFGYVAYEPVLNFAKGLLIGSVSIFALGAATVSLATGGREIAAGPAFGYAVGAAAGCFLFAEILRRILRRIESPLVRIDRRNWQIDGLISLGVAVAFLLGILLPRAGLADWAPYVDPAITAAICLVLMPVPVRILRDNWSQIVARSAPRETIREVEEILDRCLDAERILGRELRVVESGRVLVVHLYVQVDEATVSECDRLRDALWDALEERYRYPALDVSFTTNPRWFRHASGDV